MVLMLLLQMKSILVVLELIKKHTHNEILGFRFPFIYVGSLYFQALSAQLSH